MRNGDGTRTVCNISVGMIGISSTYDGSVKRHEYRECIIKTLGKRLRLDCVVLFVMNYSSEV